MFPEELPRRLIKMFSFVGDTVLDPFAGSGTTSLAAKNLQRHSIGFEINPEYRPILEEKLGVKSVDSQAQVEIITTKNRNVDFAARIADLPYIFKDPVRIDKKVDPRTRNFGTKVNKESSAREEYFTVKKVLSPNEVVLSDGSTIKLLGVKVVAAKENKALEYLKNKVLGKRVFLRNDNGQMGGKDVNTCYLYLANKTFVNAHLIKEGFADVDVSIDYKHKKRFLAKKSTQVKN